MNRKSIRLALTGVGVAVALAAAALGAKERATKPVAAVSDLAPATLEAFELAHLLSVAPPDTVVIALDSTKTPLLGAVPAATYGTNDVDIAERAPKVRKLVLVGADVVRVDRLARRLMASGRQVRVLQGGTDAWDKAMGDDPAVPPPQSSAETWAKYRTELALRRFFADKAAAAPAAPMPLQVAPAAPAGGGGAPKKREGC